jgi:hypothetical protein
MRALENRRWFLLLTFVVSGLIAAALFKVAGIDFAPRVGTVFLFTTLGLGIGVNRVMALIFIKVNPALGHV